ncbi:MAG: transposase family protein [Candidatus Thiosymbion ectosymbiont of Robbea hypermnestra]|nr:transposase family protein [Candidatus Thiosymbion ectosymbiont of Robbea hypermnestra]
MMATLIVTLCKVMVVRQIALLLGVSDRRIWRTLDHYVTQARTQGRFL